MSLPPNNNMRMRMYMGKGIQNRPVATDKLTLEMLRFLNADKNARFSKKELYKTMTKLSANQAMLLDVGFRLLDKNNNKSISKAELLSSVRTLIKGIKSITSPFM